MTARGLYEALLIELNKVEAPSLLLEDYNYFLNKAIIEYINRRYVLYDTSQQTTDDLQVLTESLEIVGSAIPNDLIQLPDNYYHLLNCVVKFKVVVPFKIYPENSIITQGARRLTAEKIPIIQNNAFLKPEYRRPYYYIRNNAAGVAPSLELRAGEYKTALELDSVTIDYLKTPATILLTEEQRDDLTDTSQVLEFPEYVANEIIKNLVALVLENAGDERLQTHPQINVSIPSQVTAAPDAQVAAPQEKNVNLRQR